MRNLPILVLLTTVVACGSTGPSGSNGAQGSTGKTGASGQPGATGAQGHAGVDGTGCQVTALAEGNPAAPNGGLLETCPDGSSAVVQNGQGWDRSQTITPIDFCPGFTQSYPSTFAESGLCIDGVTYGVYSANGGFLAMLPPGTYSSNGINASCTFEVPANCSVPQ